MQKWPLENSNLGHHVAIFSTLSLLHYDPSSSTLPCLLSRILLISPPVISALVNPHSVPLSPRSISPFFSPSLMPGVFSLRPRERFSEPKAGGHSTQRCCETSFLALFFVFLWPCWASCIWRIHTQLERRNWDLKEHWEEVEAEEEARHERQKLKKKWRKGYRESKSLLHFPFF